MTAPQKVCNKCGAAKPIDDFYASEHGIYGRTKTCKRCKKNAVKARRDERTPQNRELVYQHLLQHHCVDCGLANPVLLTFDHLRDKEFGVGQGVSQARTREKMMTEISKCEVRCFNCHIMKTAQRGEWWIFRKMNGLGKRVVPDQEPAQDHDQMTGSKICTGCLRNLPEDFFGNERAANRCRDCLRKRDRKYKAESIERRQEFVYEILINECCLDCGEKNPIKLSFDHHEDKINDISGMMYECRPLEIILAEVSKCDVRCLNCHMLKTAQERSWWVWCRHCGEQRAA